MCMLVAQSCPTFCETMDGSSPGLLIIYICCCSVTKSYLTLRTTAHRVSLPYTISRSLLKLMSIESGMPSNHLILCHPLLLLPSIFSSIRVFSSELALHIRWPQDSNVYMSVPVSQFLSPPSDSLVTISLFSTSVPLFLFCR